MSYLTFDPKSLLQKSPYVILLSRLGLYTLRYAFILLQLHLPHQWQLLLHHGLLNETCSLQRHLSHLPLCCTPLLDLFPKPCPFLLPTTPAESIIVPRWTEIPFPGLDSSIYAYPLENHTWLQLTEIKVLFSKYSYDSQHQLCSSLVLTTHANPFGVLFFIHNFQCASTVWSSWCFVVQTVTKLCRHRLGKWPWT